MTEARKPKVAREFWIHQRLDMPGHYVATPQKPNLDFQYIHVREVMPNEPSWKECNDNAIWAFAELDKYKELCEMMAEEMQRLRCAHEHALLEMSAWMGIPDRKREKQIKYLMENFDYILNEAISRYKQAIEEEK